MNPPRVWRISSRQSDLAKWQAYRVGAEIEKTCGDKIQYQFRASLGDQNQTDPLWRMPEKGVFTEDFVSDLREGKADLVVHSWKDLPTESRPGLKITATLPRADVRDVFLFRRDRLSEFKQGEKRELHVLTSSPRRAYNLESFFHDYLPFEISGVKFMNVRGNILTRVRKLFVNSDLNNDQVDGLIVAKAALDRLLTSSEDEFREGREQLREFVNQAYLMILPLSVNPTAAAQGALAVEVTENSIAEKVISQINCEETYQTVQRERQILASYGGGCHQKIGINVLRRAYGDILFLRGLTDRGEILQEKRLETVAIPRADSENAIFPRRDEIVSFFSRVDLEKSTWDWAENEDALWIARESALPKDFNIKKDAILWTAGLETWRKLARRGHWVTGSAEGLGEREDPRLEALLPLLKTWTKLTHEAAPLSTDQRIRSCPTYRLQAVEKVPDLRARSHFYWMSGSSFDRALELYPEIKLKTHVSGPGATHEHLRSRLGPDAKLYVQLDVEAFHCAVT